MTAVDHRYSLAVATGNRKAGALRRQAEVVEEVADMISFGRTWEQICQSLNMNARAVERSLSRAGRPDLISRAKGDPAILETIRLKLAAKARLGLPPTASDHDFYRAVARCLRRGDLLPPTDPLHLWAQREAKLRLARRRRLLRLVVAERFPRPEDLEREAS